MATTTLLLNGFSVVGDPQTTNANASNGGEYMLHSATALFEDNDIIVYVVDNVTVDGVLTEESVVTSIIVYDNASDYYNDVAKYTYTGSADVDFGRRTMGDRYLEIDASGLTSTDAGAPVLGDVAAIAGVNILETLATQNGPLRVDTNEDIDLNDDGLISGGEVGDGAFSSEIANGLVVICFARGTLIETPEGPRFIETLRKGDLVTTLDGGPQAVTWIGHIRVPGEGPNTPIRIRRGALENIRDLWVSPNHRMLLRGTAAELMFGETEVLVAAKHLVNGTTIVEAPCPVVEYWHILCEGHHLVFAEGCAAETLYPGQMALQSVDDADRDEILGVLPERCLDGFTGPMARYTLKRHEAELLRVQVA
ncbi:Hint domain-containing protein [Marivita sp. S6314]|uniref:Hint domain-containing protein n=1 Tax=Marivita sp. S6314 TaxID=2926406 RepID=UPI001FF2D3F7|nr:Hint domain-containing protein [Marivita sp. S6314]MCK0148954.1 Hint domain-containing protein [Marivita sp. S6314]